MSVALLVMDATLVFLGVVYLTIPDRVHRFGFESLRRSEPASSETSAVPTWAYRVIGVSALLVGCLGLYAMIIAS